MNLDRYRDVEQRLWTSLGLEPIERHVRLERLDTSVRLVDDREGPALLFIHGGSPSGDNWPPLLDRLDR